MGGISISELMIIAFIVVLLFGSKKLAQLGGDLGTAIKDFKRAIRDDGVKEEDDTLTQKASYLKE
ncbi:twin-arginine translocase TatA/TatE family subunit [Enterovibrio coralii]|uniref:Sec-independent protein translocase protein TatA n=1 Tax=Enterovibrio coralii TaxID=294935 RepID=A0A135IB21_9GAMM|nr:hypothetical protein ATN88_21530 [Enterovibrio coralii]